MKDKLPNNTIFSIILILVIVSISFGALFYFNFLKNPEQEKSIHEENSKKDAILNRREVFNISGKEAGYFSKVIFDPFLVRQGEKQTIILILNSSENIKKIKIETQDGAGKYEKSFERTLEKKEKINYKITWKPKNLKANTSYPVRFIYETYNSKINEMTLTWYSTK